MKSSAQNRTRFLPSSRFSHFENACINKHSFFEIENYNYISGMIPNLPIEEWEDLLSSFNAKLKTHDPFVRPHNESVAELPIFAEPSEDNPWWKNVFEEVYYIVENWIITLQDWVAPRWFIG